MRAREKYEPASAQPAPPKPKKPQCQQIISDAGANRRQCTRDGVQCTVYGVFGSMGRVLCGECQKTLRQRGWKVQIDLPYASSEVSKGGE